MTATTRVSTGLFFNTSINDIGRIRTELADLTNQISSGERSSTFIGLGSDTLRFQDIESSTQQIDIFIRNNEAVLNRLRQQDASISQLEDLASELSNAIATKRSPSGPAFDLADFARNALEQVQDSLSVSVSGRFLFSGGRTNTPPVNDSVLSTSNIVDGQPTANYYDGDSNILTIQASENLSLEYGITAADPAFQQLIATLNLAIEAEDVGDLTIAQETILEQASALANQTVESLAAVRNQAANDARALEVTNATHVEVRLQLTQELSALADVDVVEASIRVAENEATLQAVLQTFSRISQLSLNDFL